MSEAQFLRVPDAPAAERALRRAVPASGWLVVSVGPLGASPLRPAEDGCVGSLGELLSLPHDVLCVLGPEITSLGWGAIAGPVREALASPRQMTVLLPWAAPPPMSERRSDPVVSFLGPARALAALAEATAPALERVCFLALNALLSGDPWFPGYQRDVQIIVRQCPAPADESPQWGAHDAPRSVAAVVALPHRGPARYLRAALDALVSVNPRPTAIRVGLDAEDPSEYFPFTDAYPNVEFLACEPAPAGPYVIRQSLAESAAEPVLAFHDSDDVSCRDRFHWLLAEMNASGCGLIGSHELRIDEILQDVRGIRYPLDVTAALRERPVHSLLHPTSMVRMADFRGAGGLSTDCIFGNDTQFLLRAYFHVPIRNADRFLYVRRQRRGSLTTDLETGMANPLRQARSQAWREDFEAVKAGRRRLEESSLAAVAGSRRCRLRALAGSKNDGALPRLLPEDCR
jgi:hypothetical protein